MGWHVGSVAGSARLPYPACLPDLRAWAGRLIAWGLAVGRFRTSSFAIANRFNRFARFLSGLARMFEP